MFKTKEYVAATLATIHNQRFTVRLVDDMRTHIEAGTFAEFKAEFDKLNKRLDNERTRDQAERERDRRHLERILAKLDELHPDA